MKINISGKLYEKDNIAFISDEGLYFTHLKINWLSELLKEKNIKGKVLFRHSRIHQFCIIFDSDDDTMLFKLTFDLDNSIYEMALIACNRHEKAIKTYFLNSLI